MARFTQPNYKELIHCLCSLDSEGTPIPLLTKDTEFIPTPPRTPEEIIYNSSQKDKFILLSNSTLLEANIDIQSRPSWNMINASITQTTDFDKQICIESQIMKNTKMDKQLHSYIINVLNPLFQVSCKFSIVPSIEEQIEMWGDYVEMNKAYAETVAESCTEKDLVWVHGHELLLVPQFLKLLVPNIRIGLILYSRFPNFDSLSKAYGYQSIIKSMLMFDYSGFQTELDARQFDLTCMQFPNIELPSKERIGIYPNIINNKNLNITESIKERVFSIREMFLNKKIIYSRDSHVTNVYRTIAAFAQLLFRDPFLKHQLILIIHVCPSTVPLEELKSVPELVRQVNQLHGSHGSVPVHFYHQEMYKDEQYALMAASGLGLFLDAHPSTDIASQEFIKCQKGECAPFIVSQNSHLLSAVVEQEEVEGYLPMIEQTATVDMTATVIYETLISSDSRNRQLYAVLEDYISKNDANTSAHRFIQALSSQELISSLPKEQQYNVISSDKQSLFGLYDAII